MPLPLLLPIRVIGHTDRLARNQAENQREESRNSRLRERGTDTREREEEQVREMLVTRERTNNKQRGNQLSQDERWTGHEKEE